MKKKHGLDNSAGAGLVRLVVAVGVFMLMLTCMTLAQSGGPYEVTSSTIDGGGQTIAGGPYTATGTIGQPDAGAMTGGVFQVLGGFWPSAPVDSDGDGLADGQDNCPGTYNPSQEDTETANGMIAYWKFDGSGNTAVDSVGGNHGTVYEAQWTTGRVGGALDFDGVNDYVQTAISSSLNLNGQDVSISAWVKFDRFTDWYEGIYAYGQSGGWYTLYVSDANELHMRIGGDYLNGDSELQEDQWYYLVGVYDGDAQTITLYVNAAEDGSKEAVAWGGGIADTYAVIGANRSLATEHVNAIIDEVAVYNRALGTAEILQHYHNGLLGRGYGGDGVGDACDNCAGMFNPDQADRNSDDWGDLCECAAANLDGKGTVGLVDLAMVVSGWLGSGPGLEGDVNDDDIVDWLDLEILAHYWLDGCQR